jgi:pyrrolidone-carboxylate peptidase
MGNVQFLPESINTKKKSIVNVAPETGTISNSDLGGRAVSRKLTINSKQMEVCFISLDVVWDLAASIILYESQFFRPQAILMMGRQGEAHEFRFEGASQNMAESVAGYDAEGKQLVAQNSPQEQAILSHEPLNAQVKFSWKAESLAKSAKSLLKGTGFTTTFETQAGWEDSYLCNNVSYVIASATQNKPIVLAGGQIIMPEMILNSKTRFGFLHLPGIDQIEPKLSIETAELFARVVSHTLFTLMK